MKHRRSSFTKEYVEIADSYKPVLNKMMTTTVRCVKYDFIAPLIYIHKETSTCILGMTILVIYVWSLTAGNMCPNIRLVVKYIAECRTLKAVVNFTILFT